MLLIVITAVKQGIAIKLLPAIFAAMNAMNTITMLMEMKYAKIAYITTEGVLITDVKRL